jgi:hypothetical protein
MTHTDAPASLPARPLGDPLTPPAIAAKITDASFAALMNGLHAAMYVGVGLAVISALIGLLVARGRRVDPVADPAAAVAI